MRAMLSVLPKSAQFDRFWVLYPRKDGKIDARKAFDQAERMIRGGAETIIEALLHYPFSADPQYQPLPGTWLRRGSWMREENTPPPTVIISGAESDVRTFERMLGIGE